MDLAFTTRDVAPPDRLAAWQELVSREFIPLTITPLGTGSRPAHFEASATAHGLGELRVWRVTGSPMSARRSMRHINASTAGDYLLALHVAGAARASQDGRDVDLGPGDFALFDPARPYSITFRAAGSFAHIIYQVPRASLDARGQAGKVTALRVPAAARRAGSPPPICARWPPRSGPRQTRRRARRSSTSRWISSPARCGPRLAMPASHRALRRGSAN